MGFDQDNQASFEIALLLESATDSFLSKLKKAK